MMEMLGIPCFNPDSRTSLHRTMVTSILGSERVYADRNPDSECFEKSWIDLYIWQSDCRVTLNPRAVFLVSEYSLDRVTATAVMHPKHVTSDCHSMPTSYATHLHVPSYPDIFAHATSWRLQVGTCLCPRHYGSSSKTSKGM